MVWNVLRNIEVFFVRAGHTHKDIHKAFSRNSENLRSKDAIAVSEFIDEPRATYYGEGRVTHMKSTISWSGLFKADGGMQNVKAFSDYRFFHFLSEAWRESTVAYPTVHEA